MTAIGGVDFLLGLFTANLPEAYVVPELLDGPQGPATTFLNSRATETVDDWHAAAEHLGRLVRAVELVHAALTTPGLTFPEVTELKALYEDLASYHSPLDLSAAEVAERVRPLLERKLESELATLGVWPLPAGAPAGLYVRALAAAWTEVMKASTPKTCATPACPGPVPPTRNRKYCDQCQTSRARDRTRRSRERLHDRVG